MIFKIAICDDNKDNILEIYDNLRKYEMEFDIDFEISTYSDGASLLNAYTSPGTFNILFLDVEMPDINGLKVAEHIRKLPDSKVKIVFVSSYPEYMKDSFNVQAFHYLSKPFTREKCHKIIEQLIDSFRQSDTVKFLTGDDLNEEIVFLDDIIRFECIDSKHQRIKVILSDKEIETKGSISDYENDYSRFGFIMPSRGNLINIRHLHFFRGNNVIMTNGDKLPISRRNEKKIRDLFNNRLLIIPNY